MLVSLASRRVDLGLASTADHSTSPTTMTTKGTTSGHPDAVTVPSGHRSAGSSTTLFRDLSAFAALSRSPPVLGGPGQVCRVGRERGRRLCGGAGGGQWLRRWSGRGGAGGSRQRGGKSWSRRPSRVGRIQVARSALVDHMPPPGASPFNVHGSAERPPSTPLSHPSGSPPGVTRRQVPSGTAR